jgi:hypothetical protein
LNGVNIMIRTFVLGVCVWLCAVVCSAASPFDGKWSATAGNEKLTITLTTGEGNKVTGMIALEGGANTPIEWGFFKSDLIVFKVMREFQGTPRPFVYIGKIEGDQIAFGRRPEDLSLGALREIAATRVK